MQRHQRNFVRYVTIAAALVALLAMVPTVTLAAPGSAQATPAQPTRAQTVPAQPVSPWSLYYQVYHVVTQPGTPGELWLMVYNPTSRWVTMTFPTSQRVDFVLWRDWQPVWRASEGQMYSQLVQTEVLGPYQARFYKASLPANLAPGSYYASAYFKTQGMGQYAVAWCEVWIDGTRAADLEYNLYLRDWGWQDQGRLGLSVVNHSDMAAALEYPEWWSVRVVIYDRNGQVVWERYVPRTVPQESIAAGSSRYYFFPLPYLPAGKYTAQAWFSAAGEQPVAQATFHR